MNVGCNRAVMMVAAEDHNSIRLLSGHRADRARSPRRSAGQPRSSASEVWYREPGSQHVAPLEPASARRMASSTHANPYPRLLHRQGRDPSVANGLRLQPRRRSRWDGWHQRRTVGALRPRMSLPGAERVGGGPMPRPGIRERVPVATNPNRRCSDSGCAESINEPVSCDPALVVRTARVGKS
jgi:hypothetical protein